MSQTSGQTELDGDTLGASFSVMAKPVGSTCNLRCPYCYYLSTPRLGPARMADNTLEAFISQYIAASPGPYVSFVWHGGEPSLAGIDFFRRVVELQRQYTPAGYTCLNNLQTNGSLLDDQWCQFLADNHFDVGLSIDGTRALHDAQRPTAQGQGSYSEAAGAIARLQAHGIQPDLLCTVTADTARDAVGVYNGLRVFETGWVEFIPIIRWAEDGQLTPDSVPARAYGEFLCRIFDEWASQDLGRLNVQLFAETMRVLAGGAAGLCWMAPTCGRALVVEADGGVYSCDHYVRPDFRLGELAEDGLARLADSPRQIAFGQAKRARLARQCQACPWLELCNGGCPKDRQPDGQNVLCAGGDGLRRFFAHAVPVLKRIIEGVRADEPPALIMASLRAGALSVWQSVGRNDPCPCGSGRKAKQCCWGMLVIPPAD